MFKFTGGNFINVLTGKAFDIRGASDTEGNDLTVYNNHGALNQRFKIEYLDKQKAEQTKGLNEEYGLHINRPFFIVSKSAMNRVITVAGGYNLVITVRESANKRQQWTFDQSSKTIKSVQFRDRSIDVRGTNAYAYVTDARWYQLFKYNDVNFKNEKGEYLDVNGNKDVHNG